MKVLHLHLTKGRNIVRLRGANLNTNRDKTLQVSKCTALWSLKNIRKDFNDTITLDSTNVKIPDGYYTFNDLKTFLATHNVTITKLKSNHITLTSTKDIKLNTFGFLLGFVSDTTQLQKDTTHTSLKEANMTNGLKEIKIFSPSLVDEYKNYHYYLGQYIPSSLLLHINIDTTQSLNGTITNYNLDNLRIPLSDFTGQDVLFDVQSGGFKEDYELRVTFNIN